MCKDEAVSIKEYYSVIRESNRSLKRANRGYLLLICIMFSLAVVLYANYCNIYRSYIEIKHNLDKAMAEYKSAVLDKSDSDTKSTNLKKENDMLKAELKAISAQNEEILRQMAEIKKLNDELKRKNKELTEDNIALQNSIKMAASAGIKPQNYNTFNGISSRGEIDRGTYLGKFLGTAYTPCKEECGSNKGITYSGKPIIPGISIAIDNRYWPFGTVFYIRGLGYAVAMDAGSAVKGKYRFDFAVFDKKFAYALGSRYWQVYLVRMGNGKVDDIRF